MTNTWITVKKNNHIQKTLDGQELEKKITKNGNNYTVETFRTSKNNPICLKFLGGGLVCQLPKEHSGECNPSINCNFKLGDSI